MGEVIKAGFSSPVEGNDNEQIKSAESLTEVTENVLSGIHTELANKAVMSMPIAQLATLGAGVSSLIPALHTVTQTTTLDVGGLYKLANESIGDTLKVAKNGTFWGAFKTADGGSKFARLKEVGKLTVTNTSSVPIDPATMMMAVALFSIEQQLGNIAEMEKQILSFLEIEKESEIEADVRTLSGIMTNYKYNWDNSLFIASNHKMVLDIQRSARAHMLAYQAMVSDEVKSRQMLIAQKQVNATLEDFLRKFKYYRLSLFTYSMACLVEVMLSGNFKEEYIGGVGVELRKLSFDYRQMFSDCSIYLEKLAGAAVDKKVVKGIGTAGKALGRAIGSIPVIKRGAVDEFLQDKGTKLQKSAESMETDAVRSFAALGNPGVQIFISRLEDMAQIFNHTAEIGFDEKQIFLIAGSKAGLDQLKKTIYV